MLLLPYTPPRIEKDRTDRNDTNPLQQYIYHFRFNIFGFCLDFINIFVIKCLGWVSRWYEKKGIPWFDELCWKIKTKLYHTVLHPNHYNNNRPKHTQYFFLFAILVEFLLLKEQDNIYKTKMKEKSMIKHHQATALVYSTKI